MEVHSSHIAEASLGEFWALLYSCVRWVQLWDSLSSLLENCKSKPQCGIILHQPEWLLSKRLQAINAGEGMEKREHCYTVGGNANWYRHCGEQYGNSLIPGNRTVIWPSNHNGVITHLEPDILECEVKWALGTITTSKARGGAGIHLSYFKS